MASPARLERAAFRLGGERSILLSYGCKGLFPVSTENRSFLIIVEIGEKVNLFCQNQSPSEMPMLLAARTACASAGTNFVLPATSESGLWETVLPTIATA